MFNQFRNNFPVSDEQWNNYISCFKKIKVPAKTVLLKEGEVPRKMFLIEKGCIRVAFNNNGKDVTSQFFFENNMVSSIESFKKSIPSPVMIETIEPCTIWTIQKKEVDRIIAEIGEIPVLRTRLIDGLFERTFDYINHFVSFIRDTPQQRYLNLVKERPQVVQRVPQHYIASYLGISSVHLSRIKQKMAKNNH